MFSCGRFVILFRIDSVVCILLLCFAGCAFCVVHRIYNLQLDCLQRPPDSNSSLCYFGEQSAIFNHIIKTVLRNKNELCDIVSRFIHSMQIIKKSNYPQNIYVGKVK